jgi:hypothetical protein
MVNEHPLQNMFGATHLSSDGRVIAKNLGVEFGESAEDDGDVVVHLEMMKNYQIMMQVAVKGSILPALEVLAVEHRLLEMDLIHMARNSPVVPIGREMLYGKALYFGFQRDFASAVHLLTPQIEHLVRSHLKSVGALTTTVNSDGIEQEKGLSALMDDPKADQVFGPDLAYELRSLFCGPTGPNLRNDLAHGLVDDAAAQSIKTCYAWWFGFRLAFGAYWGALQSQGDDKPGDAAAKGEHGDGADDEPTTESLAK